MLNSGLKKEIKKKYDTVDRQISPPLNIPFLLNLLLLKRRRYGQSQSAK